NFSGSTRYRDMVTGSATRAASASRRLSARTARKFLAIFRRMYSPIRAKAVATATAVQVQKASQAGAEAGASAHQLAEPHTALSCRIVAIADRVYAMPPATTRRPGATRGAMPP